MGRGLERTWDSTPGTPPNQSKREAEGGKGLLGGMLRANVDPENKP